MTGIWRKKQGFIRKQKPRATQIDYNTVAHFYIVICIRN